MDTFFIDKLKNFAIDSTIGCHNYLGRLDRDGYGIIKRKLPNSRKHKLWKAHRLAWESANGPIPEGMLVCHKCDNRRCINVEHLFIGTIGDNNRDAIAKKRRNKSKISLQIIDELRYMFSSGEYTIAYLARKFAISETHTRRLLLVDGNKSS